MQIKCNLNKILADRNISFRQLERMSGVSYSMLNLIANGKKLPSLKSAFAISMALNVTVEELFSAKKE
ncbi:MAG: helix-turn-helix transcriptional regulator [Acetivibrio ethanolgignens]